jgi:hypothetical protein
MMLTSAAFMALPRWNVGAVHSSPAFSAPSLFLSSQDDHNSPSQTAESEGGNLEKNSAYIHGLLENLTAAVDKWIMTGSPASQKRVYNVLQMIQSEAMDPELVKKGERCIKRAGLPVPVAQKRTEATVDVGANDEKKRRQEAEARRSWEASRTSEVGDSVAANAAGRSALSRRETTNGKPDLFMPQIDKKGDPTSLAKVAKDKQELEKALVQGKGSALSGQDEETVMSDLEMAEASAKVSQMVAKAGGGSAFKGESLGIGGLDDGKNPMLRMYAMSKYLFILTKSFLVLAQVKRRVWIPLAAPPQLLEELGIHPVRGLLLYGKPGCGKTLLASKLGQMLSPLRPITVVNGPEIMDKVRSIANNTFASRQSRRRSLFLILSSIKQSLRLFQSGLNQSSNVFPFFLFFLLNSQQFVGS